MPGPDPFPCGGPGQKACPPTPALETIPTVTIVKLYHSLTPEQITWALGEIQKEPK